MLHNSELKTKQLLSWNFVGKLRVPIRYSGTNLSLLKLTLSETEILWIETLKIENSKDQDFQRLKPTLETVFKTDNLNIC